MRLDQNPFFRKIILPWYDSDTACYIVIACMVIIILFSFTGISVTREIPEYRVHIWVPVLLVVMCTGVIVSTAIRLAKRYLRRYSK
jgi:hypothetical protein